MTDDFRHKINPSFRRQTNKAVNELSNLRVEYEKTKLALEEANKQLEREKDILDQITSNLEYARNSLSSVQAEIDADYLPEGAQPRKRIEDRDSLLQVTFSCYCFLLELLYLIRCI
jgi:predicted  nucleic acid-binding Zn-ribbon protein